MDLWCVKRWLGFIVGVIHQAGVSPPSSGWAAVSKEAGSGLVQLPTHTPINRMNSNIRVWSWMYIRFFTVRNVVAARKYFHRRLSVIPFTGGCQADTPWASIPLWADTPLADTPSRYLHWQTPPFWQIPPWPAPPGRHLPWPDTPSGPIGMHSCFHIA